METSSLKTKRKLNKINKVTSLIHLIEMKSPPVKKKCISERHVILDDGKPIAMEAAPSTEHGGKNGKEKKVELSAMDYQELKARLRERKKFLMKLPRLILEDAGKKASLDVCESLRVPLYVTDLQNLIMTCCLGHNSSTFDCTKRWCHLEKYTEISNTTVIVVEGLTSRNFIEFRNELSFLDTTFGHKLEMVAPVICGKTMIDMISNVSVSTTYLKKLLKEHGNLDTAVENYDVSKYVSPVIPISVTEPKLLAEGDKFPRTQLLLSTLQLFKEGYPLCIKLPPFDRFANFVPTKDMYDQVTDVSPMFSLDCEMCSTTKCKMELTRIAVVNEDLEVVYHTFVKPDNEITNYMTRYSGITPELLEGVTVRLKDVQEAIRCQLPPNAILIGQSLNFDLLSLKMTHPYIIDTSVIYNISGVRHIKTKLATLSKYYLRMKIQQSTSGHCPTEDSRTAMQLVKLKLSRGKDFGDCILEPIEFETSELPRNEKYKNYKSSQDDETYQLVTNIFSHLAKDKPATVIGSTEVLKEYSKYLQKNLLNPVIDRHENGVKLIKVDSDEDLITQTCQAVSQTGTIISHVQVSLNHEKLVDGNSCRIINDKVKQIWDMVPYKGLFVIVFDGSCMENGNNTKDDNSVLFIQLKIPASEIHCRKKL